MIRRRVRGWWSVLVMFGCSGAPGHTEAEKPLDAPAAGSSSLSRRSEAVRADPVDGSPTLQVLSFNVNFGVGHDPRNVQAIGDADADIVLLQETTDEVEAAVRDALSDRYPHMLFRSCCRAGGLGLLSKREILDEHYLEATEGWFPAWRVVVQTDLGPVQTLNVHLRPPMSDSGSWVAGYFSTRDVRRKEIESFWQALDPRVPTVVAGDFNENAKGRAVGFLADQGLVSALPQKAPRAKTWSWQTKVGRLAAQLDHVVYSDHFALVDARVHRKGTSDHYPVVVRLASR